MKLRVEMSRRDGTTYVNVRGGAVEDSLELPPPRGGLTAVVADVDADGRLLGLELLGDAERTLSMLREPGFWQELADGEGVAGEPYAVDLRRIGASLIEAGPDAVFVLRHGD
ncbi:hypothetical protein ACX8Z9_03900 [Arthrobacter halodurans]|uniref:DUF2283 domain-containing protein n=1 Tax=Arthrobacter halodurans TaxID=516699 RepID=A0ABV4UN57_9MICC